MIYYEYNTWESKLYQDCWEIDKRILKFRNYQSKFKKNNVVGLKVPTLMIYSKAN